MHVLRCIGELSWSTAYITSSQGTGYVPGRVSGMQLIFASSIPHVIVAIIAFVLLWVLTIFAHFRRGKYYDFTLVNLGAALHQSEIPEQFAQAKARAAEQAMPQSRWVHYSADKDVVEMLEAHDTALGELWIHCGSCSCQLFSPTGEMGLNTLSYLDEATGGVVFQ